MLTIWLKVVGQFFTFLIVIYCFLINSWHTQLCLDLTLRDLSTDGIIDDILISPCVYHVTSNKLLCRIVFYTDANFSIVVTITKIEKHDDDTASVMKIWVKVIIQDLSW